MNFIFWNIHKNRNIFPAIRELVITEDVDILMLAEYPECTIEELLKTINKEPSLYTYQYVPSNSPTDKVKIFTRFDISFISNSNDRNRLSAKQLFSTLLNMNITLITCHLPSKINMTDDELSEYSTEVAEFIEEVEQQVGHQRTVICGDFNMNPFDKGMIKTKGMHAVMDKSVIRNNEAATVRGHEYEFLYNPMWGFLGDTGKGKVSGTMYYNSSQSINFYWHIYDQVLIRPELISYFDDSLLEIITHINQDQLITSNFVIDKQYSDHLPIKFNLKI